MKDDSSQDQARRGCSCTFEGFWGCSSSIWQDEEDGYPWCSQVSLFRRNYVRNMFCLVNAVESLLFLCLWWIRVLRLQPGHKYCLLGQLSSEVGWNHYDTIKVWIVYLVSSFFTFAACLWCYYLWPSYLDVTYFKNSLNCI